MIEQLGSYTLVTIYFMSLALLSLFGAHRYLMLYFYYKRRPSGPIEVAAPAELPHVTVQLPIYNEQFVVQRLLESMAYLDYPKEKLEIQVLDDSTDETQQIARQMVSKLAADGLDIVYIHRTDRTGYKAGALQNGLEVAKGEFIAIFDADFIPPPEFLRKTIARLTDPEVGMVQMRWDHLNREFSILTQCQSIMLDGHFVIEHAARHFSGRFFNFNGTAGVWRRSAIIDAGGWQHDTLTEDLDLSYRAQLRGWKFVYVPHLAAPAEVPVEMNAFKTQQHRWTKGSIQTALKLLPRIWRSTFPIRVKVEATFHLANNFAYLLLLLVAVLMLPVMMVREQFSVNVPFVIDLIMFMAASVSIVAFYIASQFEVLPTWKRQLRFMPLMMSLGVGLCVNNAKAVLEALFGVESSFVRTPKYGVRNRTENWWKTPYLSKAGIVAGLESLLAIYYAYIVAYCIYRENFYTLPFMLLFLVGFGYVGSQSLVSLFRRPMPTAAPKPQVQLP